MIGKEKEFKIWKIKSSIYLNKMYFSFFKGKNKDYIEVTRAVWGEWGSVR